MIHSLFDGFFQTMLEVLFALAPFTAVFLLFHFFHLKLSKRKLLEIAFGVFMAYIGFVLFLHGVHIGFIPVGEAMGEYLSSLTYNWILIPIGFILGFTATYAEPAVRILNDQVEKTTGGYIQSRLMLYTLSIGVGVSIALSMFRILSGFSLLIFVIPGYILAFVLAFMVNRTFLAIAFDSGGVATGPMTVTFILALSVGSASGIEGRNPLVDGFGMIALVALTPILSILILGVAYARKEASESEFIRLS